MELPKNITQIGESDKSCKIYVEDYVVSYIKQRNRLAENKKAAVALYGIRREEMRFPICFCMERVSWKRFSVKYVIFPRRRIRR